MSATVLDMSMSLDGYVTGPNDSRENPFGDGAEMLHDWIFDAATEDDGPSRFKSGRPDCKGPALRRGFRRSRGRAR